jgi:hypothetical protein
MSEIKSHQFRPPLYHRESSRDGRTSKSAAASQERGREQQGWDAYRKWLSTVSGKAPTERSPLDHSIYSWKGYQNWADKVKQSWKPEES